MSVSWSKFGLDEPAPGDRDRLVILGGGRALVLGVPWNGSWRDGSFDDRFHVSWSRIAPSRLLPARGDIVLWRGYSATDPEDWGLWGAPTRILDVERHDDHVDVWCLEDADLTDRLDAEDIGRSFVEHDRVLDETELWEALMRWGAVNPYCSRCGGEILPIMYGMPPSDPGTGVIVGGCVILSVSPVARCSRCKWNR